MPVCCCDASVERVCDSCHYLCKGCGASVEEGKNCPYLTQHRGRAPNTIGILSLKTLKFLTNKEIDHVNDMGDAGQVLFDEYMNTFSKHNIITLRLVSADAPLTMYNQAHIDAEAALNVIRDKIKTLQHPAT
jgi:hypothetical protein